VKVFGPLLAQAAYERGFHAADRKAFVADGSSTNWGVWSRYFSHYTPILDFVHALMYVYAAAHAGQSSADGWRDYRQWAQWLWSGNIESLLAAVTARHAFLGDPTAVEENSPRRIVADALRYLTNQRGRMNYAEYRRRGLPITSSHIESTIKQLNSRMKGSEKFWDRGTEPMLQLVADHLSETPDLGRFWRQRPHRLVPTRRYHSQQSA